MTNTVPQTQMSEKQFEFFSNLIRPALNRFTTINTITAHVSDKKKVISIKAVVTVWKGSTPVPGVFTRKYKAEGDLAKVYYW